MRAGRAISPDTEPNLEYIGGVTRAVAATPDGLPTHRAAVAGPEWPRSYPLRRPRRAHAKTQLPSGEEAEGGSQKGAPTREATTPVSPPGEYWRSRRRGAHVPRARNSARDESREPNVRLSSSSPAALRQERAERLRRERAAAPALRVAFPAVEQLRLELKFEGAATNIPTDQSHVLHPPARAFFEFPCPYADCDGQFDLTGVVSTTLANGLPAAEGVLKCSGQRLDRSASRIPCQLDLRYAFTVMYQAAD